MKPLKHLSIFAGILILFSCSEEPIPKPLPEADYPYTYSPLSTTTWAERNSEFQTINIYDGLSLDEYGFVEGEISISEVDSLTEEFVVDKLDSIVNRYKSFLGITTNINVENDIRINIPFLVGGSGSGTINYYFEGLKYYQQQDYWPELKEKFTIQRYFITQSKINNKNFLGPTLYFIFNGMDKTIQISGNWLPDVYIPQNEIYSIDDAITKTYRFILNETGKDLWESKTSFATIKTFIFLEIENEITIHECWRCIVTMREEGHFYYIFIDTQTGEIIYNYKRGMYYM